MKIPAKDVETLCLIDTFDLYGLINDGVNKYNNRDTVQVFINDMVGNINDLTVVESGNEATVASKFWKDKPVVVHENNDGNTKLADTELKSNNILGAHIMEEKEGWVYGWTGTYDEWDNYYHTPTEENEPGSLFMGDDSIFKLTNT